MYRALRYHGFPRKNKQEAQKSYLERSGNHPTKGKERNVEEKKKIGKGVRKYWTKLSPEQLNARIDRSREMWYNLSEKTREEYLKKSHKALREASVKGSKFEKFLLVALMAAKFRVQPHKKFLFEDSQMHCDIYLPVEGICIEVDGYVHFWPIFGEEQLKERIEKDLLKNEQLLSQGYTVVRIQNPKGYSSKTVMEDFCAKFVIFLKKLTKEPGNTFHEILVDEFLQEGN